MALPMVRPWKHSKTGVYWFRRRVPRDLRSILGKFEEKRSLGTKDPEQAKRVFVRILADVETQWANLRAGPQTLTEREAHALARTIYDNWLAAHRDEPSAQYVWHVELYGQLWTLPGNDSNDALPPEVSVDTFLVGAMRSFCFRQADLGLIEHGLRVDEDSRGKLARAVGAAVQRASLVLQQEAEGDFSDEPLKALPAPAFSPSRSSDTAYSSSATPARRPSPGSPAVTLTSLLEDWWREAKGSGRKPSTYESYRNTFSSLRAFLKHDDASRITPETVVAYKNHRLATVLAKTGKLVSPRTVRGSDLAALSTIFKWAVANRRLPSNPAVGVTVAVSKQAKLRSKGFSDAEASAILTAASNYQDGAERPWTAAAKRWVPWLCAYTGARVGELAQLRKQDVRCEGEHWIITITPEAGTVKTNEAREVVLHPHLEELGFPAFVGGREAGHLFLRPAKNGDVLGPLQGVKNRLTGTLDVGLALYEPVQREGCWSSFM